MQTMRIECSRAQDMCWHLQTEVTLGCLQQTHVGRERRSSQVLEVCDKEPWATCIQCKVPKDKSEFGDWLATRTRKVNDGKARCNACKQEQNTMCMESLRESVSHVFVHRQK